MGRLGDRERTAARVGDGGPERAALEGLWSEGPSEGPLTRFAPAATAASTIAPALAICRVFTVTELLAVKLSTFEPFSFMFGESEI